MTREELDIINTLDFMESTDNARANALCFCTALSLYYNAFGNHEKRTQALCESLTPSGRQNLEKLFVLLGIKLAREQEKINGNNGWDDERVRKSRELAYKNYLPFLDGYRALFGSDYSPNTFPSLSAGRTILAEMINEHPTIKQSMFGGMYRYFVESENKSEVFADKGFTEDHGFPLI